MSATQVQFRRGTDAQNNSFTGADGEITIDTTNHQIRVHDGSTPGGFAAPAVTPTGNLTVTGNITAAYFVGNGAALTGLPAGYANSDAVAYAESGWAGNIIPSANITYDLGNATNRWNDIWLANSTIHLGEVSISATGANLQLPTTVKIGNVTLSESGGNLALPENISANTVVASGNITGNFILGNGSQLTGLPATYANANVASFLSNGFGSNTISTTGNITGGNINDSKGEVRLVPINSQSASYTLTIEDAGRTILHPLSDNNNRTFTIPANSSVAYPIGTVLTFINQIATVSISINSDTLYLSGAGSTGTRSLTAWGVATAIKLTSTTWIISGNNLS